jgi:hypothetical protein
MESQAFERFPALAVWMERFANARIEGLSLLEWGDFCAAVNDVAQIALLAEELVSPAGMVNRGIGHGLVVVERADKSDPHYRLCTALAARSRSTSGGK